MRAWARSRPSLGEGAATPDPEVTSHRVDAASGPSTSHAAILESNRSLAGRVSLVVWQQTTKGRTVWAVLRPGWQVDTSGRWSPEVVSGRILVRNTEGFMVWEDYRLGFIFRQQIRHSTRQHISAFDSTTFDNIRQHSGSCGDEATAEPHSATLRSSRGILGFA